MTFDSPAGMVVIGAVVVMLVGLAVFGIASTRAAVLLGMRDDSLWWFSPRGGRTQGFVIAYLAAIVALSAFVNMVATALLPEGGAATSLTWTLTWVVGLGLFALTAVRATRFMVTLATGGRAALDQPIEEDFVEADEAGDDIDVRAARAAAFRGDWAPAAHLLAATEDHDVRWDRALVLGDATARRRAWLDDWLVADPGDRNAQAVRVTSAIARVWQARGAAEVPHDMEAFVEAVADAVAIARDASEKAPDDVVPLVALVLLARVEEVAEEDLDRRLAAVLGIAPRHRAAHEEALQYKSAKWFGSADAMFAFARSAASDAPPGDPLHLLVAVAHIEQYMALAGRGGTFADRYMTSDSTRTELRTAADRWLADTSPVGRVWGHNVLACAAYLAEMPDLLASQIEQTKTALLPWPWQYLNDPSVAHAVATAWSRSHPPAKDRDAATR